MKLLMPFLFFVLLITPCGSSAQTKEDTGQVEENKPKKLDELSCEEKKAHIKLYFEKEEYDQVIEHYLTLEECLVLPKDQYLSSLFILYQMNGQLEKSYDVCREIIDFVDNNYSGNKALLSRSYYNLIIGEYDAIIKDLNKVNESELTEDQKKEYDWWYYVCPTREFIAVSTSSEFGFQLLDDMPLKEVSIKLVEVERGPIPPQPAPR